MVWKYVANKLVLGLGLGLGAELRRNAQRLKSTIPTSQRKNITPMLGYARREGEGTNTPTIVHASNKKRRLWLYRTKTMVFLTDQFRSC